MESGRLWASIARHWLLSSIVLVLVLAGAFAAAYLPKRSYEATATIGVVPNAPAAATSNATTQLAQVMIGNFLAQIDSKTTEARVRTAFTGPEATTAWTVRGDNDPGTLVLRIHVTSQDPSVVATVATAYSRAIRTAQSTPPGIAFTVIDEARVPTSPVSPNRPLILGAGGVLAIVLASFAALLAGNKPKRPRLQQSPRVSPGAVATHNAPVSFEKERTAEPSRG
jgi:polysaccharide biosynthesis transport protein